jgi:hypothetical protein
MPAPVMTTRGGAAGEGSGKSMDNQRQRKAGSTGHFEIHVPVQVITHGAMHRNFSSESIRISEHAQDKWLTLVEQTEKLQKPFQA